MKITPESLRIGNKVDLYGTIATIQGTDFVNHYTTNDKRFDRFKSIPLTEKWLLDFGYKKTGNIYFGKYHQIIEATDNVYVCNKNGIIIKYVHQLQNLYFAVVGEELINK